MTKGSCFVGASLRNPQNLQPKLGQNQTVAGTFLTGPGVPGKVHACIDGLTSTLGGPVTLRFFQGVMGGSAGPDVPLTAVDLQSFNAFDVQLKEYDGACYSMSVIGSDGTVLASGFNHCDAQGVSDQ